MHGLDLIRPTDLHNNGAPQRTGGLASGSRGRREQSGHQDLEDAFVALAGAEAEALR